MKISVLPLLSLAIPLLFPAFAVGQADWKPDYATAFDVAKKEKKDLFVFVTGNDWSKQSADYHAKLLASLSLTAFGEQFVFVEIDKPDLPTEEQKETAKKNDGFKMIPRRFPGVALLDPDGRVWFAAGDLKGTPDLLFKKIDDAKKIKAKRDEWLARAEKSSGFEKAEALAAAIELMERHDADKAFPARQHDHRGLLKEIKKLDPEDKTGCVRRLEFDLLSFFERQIEPLLRDKKFDEARVLLDKEFADPRNTIELKQGFLAQKFRTCQAAGDIAGADGILREIIRLAPKTKLGQIAGGYLDCDTKPIILKNGHFDGSAMRPFFGDLRIDVSPIVQDAGEYEAVITLDSGSSMNIEGASLRLGDITKEKTLSRELAKVDAKQTVRDNQKPAVLPLVVSKIPNGSRVWLCVPAQGTGWFGNFGSIELRKKPTNGGN